MKEYVCLKDCFYRERPGLRAVHYKAGIVRKFKNPPNENLFKCIEDVEIDFNTVSLKVLLRSENWEEDEAIEYIESLGQMVEDEDSLTRREIAKLVLDARYRTADIPEKAEDNGVKYTDM